MIKAWTYAEAPRLGNYWMDGGGRSMVFIEGDSIEPQFRLVTTGSADCYQSPYDASRFRGQPLPVHHWPQWLLDLDDMGVDEGL